MSTEEKLRALTLHSHRVAGDSIDMSAHEARKLADAWTEFVDKIEPDE